MGLKGETSHLPFRCRLRIQRDLIKTTMEGPKSFWDSQEKIFATYIYSNDDDDDDESDLRNEHETMTTTHHLVTPHS